jgi:hypothetical protein
MLGAIGQQLGGFQAALAGLREGLNRVQLLRMLFTPN